MVEGKLMFKTHSKYNIFKYLHKFSVLRGFLPNKRMLGKNPEENKFGLSCFIDLFIG